MLRVPGACGVAGLRNTPGRTDTQMEIGRPDGGGVSRRPETIRRRAGGTPSARIDNITGPAGPLRRRLALLRLRTWCAWLAVPTLHRPAAARSAHASTLSQDDARNRS